jgi:SAM-dependent methyltransferase
MEFINRLEFSPFVLKLVGKYVYPAFTRLLGADELLFINLAYEEDPPMALPLAASDEPDRVSIQLYYTATQADLSGKRVLEVSCGHGGGASYLVRTLRPSSYTGLDLNPAGIAFCRKRHNLPGLDFVQGDAENLPFPDQSFDAVINIEASPLLPSVSPFPRRSDASAAPRRAFPVRRCPPPPPNRQVGSGAGRRPDAAAFAHGHQCAGSARDGEAFAAYAGPIQSPCAGVSARLSPRLAREFAGVQGSGRYRNVQSGEWSYRVYCFAKIEAASRPGGSPDRRDYQHVAAPHQQSQMPDDLAGELPNAE